MLLISGSPCKIKLISEFSVPCPLQNQNPGFVSAVSADLSYERGVAGGQWVEQGK